MDKQIDFDTNNGLIKTTVVSTSGSADNATEVTTVESKSAARVITELQDKVALHTANIGQYQQNKADDIARLDAQIAAEQVLLDTASKELGDVLDVFQGSVPLTPVVADPLPVDPLPVDPVTQ
jgi:hypothetical protein